MGALIRRQRHRKELLEMVHTMYADVPLVITIFPVSISNHVSNGESCFRFSKKSRPISRNGILETK